MRTSNMFDEVLNPRLSTMLIDMGRHLYDDLFTSVVVAALCGMLIAACFATENYQRARVHAFVVAHMAQAHLGPTLDRFEDDGR